MKTYQTEPALSISEFLELERKGVDYDGVCYDSAIELSQAFAQYASQRLRTGSPAENDRLIWKYLLPAFLFDCGRIYGIRQERARRRGPAGSTPAPASAQPTPRS